MTVSDMGRQTWPLILKGKMKEMLWFGVQIFSKIQIFQFYFSC
jgi:hypothetical protein